MEEKKSNFIKVSRINYNLLSVRFFLCLSLIIMSMQMLSLDFTHVSRSVGIFCSIVFSMGIVWVSLIPLIKIACVKNNFPGKFEPFLYFSINWLNKFLILLLVVGFLFYRTDALIDSAFTSYNLLLCIILLVPFVIFLVVFNKKNKLREEKFKSNKQHLFHDVYLNKLLRIISNPKYRFIELLLLFFISSLLFLSFLVWGYMTNSHFKIPLLFSLFILCFILTFMISAINGIQEKQFTIAHQLTEQKIEVTKIIENLSAVITFNNENKVAKWFEIKGVTYGVTPEGGVIDKDESPLGDEFLDRNKEIFWVLTAASKLTN